MPRIEGVQYTCPNCEAWIQVISADGFVRDGSEWECDDCGAHGAFMEFTDPEGDFWCPVQWGEADNE